MCRGYTWQLWKSWVDRMNFVWCCFGNIYMEVSWVIGENLQIIQIFGWDFPWKPNHFWDPPWPWKSLISTSDLSKKLSKHHMHVHVHYMHSSRWIFRAWGCILCQPHVSHAFHSPLPNRAEIAIGIDNKKHHHACVKIYHQYDNNINHTSKASNMSYMWVTNR